MRKYLLTLSSIILLTTIVIFTYLSSSVTKNIKTNKKILQTFNNIFSNQISEVPSPLENNLPKLEINNIDYIGAINVPNNNISLPVKSSCGSSYIGIESACNYSNKDLIILGTNLKDSFNSYKSYNVNDTITFTNMLGQKYQYKINKIKRINNLNKLTQYEEELILIIKNYYAIEYIMFICSSN